MENEIKVNEFVRLKNGRIVKVKEVKENEIYFDSDIYFLDGIPVFETENIFSDFIVKHSPNLIDIIQKDDFVNKCRVYEVEEKGITVYQTVENSATDYNWISFDEIEEVVTKEMMESISYKVETH